MTNTDRPAPAPLDDAARIGSKTITAIEHAWAAIRANHPELPEIVVIMGGGLVPGGLKLGHFARDIWAHREAGTDNALDVGAEAAVRRSELFVGAEGLARQPHEVLATLLHEAAHALAHVRGIQDTSRQGRWHNRRFAELAGEVGITVTKDARIGYSITAITDETVTRYMGTIMELELALTHVRALPALVKVDSRPRRPRSAGASRSPRPRCAPAGPVRAATAAGRCTSRAPRWPRRRSSAGDAWRRSPTPTDRLPHTRGPRSRGPLGRVWSGMFSCRPTCRASRRVPGPCAGPAGRLGLREDGVGDRALRAEQGRHDVEPRIDDGEEAGGERGRERGHDRGPYRP